MGVSSVQEIVEDLVNQHARICRSLSPAQSKMTMALRMVMIAMSVALTAMVVVTRGARKNVPANARIRVTHDVALRANSAAKGSAE